MACQTPPGSPWSIQGEGEETSAPPPSREAPSTPGAPEVPEVSAEPQPKSPNWDLILAQMPQGPQLGPTPRAWLLVEKRIWLAEWRAQRAAAVLAGLEPREEGSDDEMSSMASMFFRESLPNLNSPGDIDSLQRSPCSTIQRNHRQLSPSSGYSNAETLRLGPRRCSRSCSRSRSRSCSRSRSRSRSPSKDSNHREGDLQS